MGINDRVHLVTDVAPCSAGDEGVVRCVDSHGRMTIEITHRADCTPFTFLLLGVMPDEIAAGANCDDAARAVRTEAAPAASAARTGATPTPRSAKKAAKKKAGAKRAPAKANKARRRPTR
jgi:hypothetical protein